MPISSRYFLCCVAACVTFSGAAFALDEKKAAAIVAAPAPPAPAAAFVNPQQALGKYIEGYRAGNPGSSIEALRYAAEGGEALARWKLGSMYAAGDGVPHDDRIAYDYFLKIIEDYDDSTPASRQRGVIASAYLALGAYALSGIPNSRVARDPSRAAEMFTVAATEFGDPHAQYNLGRMYLDGDGIPRDARRGARWLKLAADKSHVEAQAVLGHLYFTGAEGIQRQRALGLMYLTLARDAVADRKKDKWIADLYDNASKAANDLDRQAALIYLENHVRGRH